MVKKTAAWLLAACLVFLSACGGAPSASSPQETEPPAEEMGNTLPPEETPGRTEEEANTSKPMPDEPDKPAATPEPTPDEGGEKEDGGAPEGEKPVETPEPTAPEEGEQGEPLTKEEIAQRYLEAMTAMTPEIQLDITGMTWTYGAENDLKNIFYSVTGEHRELKYTYDVQTTISGNTATCRFLYMPYKTGAYDGGLPAGSHTVNTLRDAKIMAQSMIDGTERLSIAITDPTLQVEDLQNALEQAGYGWIYFSLSRDGTEIQASAPVGKTLDDCVTAINESFRLAGEVLNSVVTEGMTDLEKAGALYSYVVSNTAYDFRYYSDRNSMPYESTVALGALRDGLAICGGFAQAFQTLLDMAGIENYTVAGVSHGEYHMWNYVVLDGQGYYCDPTADRGGMSGHFMLTEEELNALGGYSWDADFLERISGAAR